ncbi:radical SAM family heme chaperone HemW [Chitinivorax sp. B]|uniref:radical SAM family heme chaperone HemW n=1 Tax=Chitinivorax sp. B TaxID=2502235 RepID=UPI00148556DA|nr:radical SAM family heme chaperone HemW [Chitinivorax sp. B]
MSGIALPMGRHTWRLQALPPLALYIHMPWCVRKCPYCDFNSHEAKGEMPEQAYLDALVRDLELALPAIWGRRVVSIFFGGGTPSLFSAAGLDRLLCDIRARVNLHTDAEITLEANPGTFEADKFRDYRAAGINRLSIGIQSFNPRHLKALGRIHDDNEARRAIEIAHRHFDNFNLDLMYALPGQTMAEASQDLRTAVAMESTHLSAYHLTLEPNTLFYRYPPELPDDEQSADMQEMVESALAEAGFDHYETSGFAKPGQYCKHNLNYWQFGDYLGIGAGAHSKLSFHDRIVREMRYKQPAQYMQQVAAGTPVHEHRQVSLDQLPFEFMMNLMRLTGGFLPQLFAERTGLQLTVVEQALQQAEQKGLVARDHTCIRPTLTGQRFLNDLLQLFLTEEPT